MSAAAPALAPEQETAPRPISTPVSRADHVHMGVRGLSSNGSNTLVGDVNLQAGTGIALGVAAGSV